MSNLKLLCVSLFVVAAIASGFLGSGSEPAQIALLQLTGPLR